MPIHRDVHISLVTVQDGVIVPEYAPLEDSTLSETEHPVLSAEATTSTVFSPLLPQSQIWIIYRVDPHPAFRERSHYLFRLFVNGREVTKWDCGKESGHSGRLEFAIVRDHTNGTLTRRGLHFVSAHGNDRLRVQGSKDDQDDSRSQEAELNIHEKSTRGCVMQIQVHRVKARRRINVPQNVPDLLGPVGHDLPDTNESGPFSAAALM